MTTAIQQPDQMVFEFIEAFEASRDHELWLKLVREERREVIEAAANLLKELSDLAYILFGANTVGVSDETILEQVGEIPDVVDDLIDAFPEEVIQEAFRRVHASNMSKLGDDGKPVRREDGKIMKGPNYKPPFLDDLITGVPSVTAH